VCSFEHTIRACVFYRTHTLLFVHLDILNPQAVSIFVAKPCLPEILLARKCKADQIALELEPNLFPPLQPSPKKEGSARIVSGLFNTELTNKFVFQLI
jgi:hypothetical protein